MIDGGVGTIQLRPSLREVHKALEGWEKDIYNRWEPHNKVGRYVRSRVKTAITKQQTVEGQRWPALKQATIKRKMRNPDLSHDASKALMLTGRLKRSIHYKVLGVTPFGNAKVMKDGSSGATVTRISPERLGGGRMVEARMNQGKGLGTHLSAGPHGNAKIPSRPYLGISADMESYIQRIFVTYITQSRTDRLNKIRG